MCSLHQGSTRIVWVGLVVPDPATPRVSEALGAELGALLLVGIVWGWGQV